MDLIKGGALLAVVIGFWDKIKNMLWFLISIFIEKTEIKKKEISSELIGYLFYNHRYVKNYNKVYSANYEYFRSGKYGLIPYEEYGAYSIIFFTNKKFLFKLLRLPFFYSISNMTNNASENKDESKKQNSAYIYSIRGTIKIDELLIKIIELRNKKSWEITTNSNVNNRFNIYYFPSRSNGSKPEKEDEKEFSFSYYWYLQSRYRLLNVNSQELGKNKISKNNALESLFFPDEILSLINEIKLWLNNKKWFKEKNIPWKKGWLLYGKPGTGKTALARAFAEDLNLPIYSFSLAQLENEDFINYWNSMQANIPCIALIEDFDNVFDKRKNISLSNRKNQSTILSNKEGKIKYPLNFDTILNCLDGIDKSDGIFTIITTNDISKIDPAIGLPSKEIDNYTSSRPGRIDKVIELSYISKENKIKMANYLLNEYPNALKKVVNKIDNKKITPAQFQEYCSKIALHQFWKNS